MNPTHEDQLAAFRYGLIAPIVCRQTLLLPGELKAFMEEVAGQVYDIPGSTRQQISALGIQLSHSRPFRPAGRGKIERYFQFVDTSFKPEAYQQIEAGHIGTLEELNRAFAAWLDGYYHIRKHGSTGVSPKARLQESQRKTTPVSAEKLTDIFLWEEERTVDKAGCVSVVGNQYEVSLELVKRRILLRYDPFDLSCIQVWFKGERYEDATTIDLTRPYHHKVKPDEPQQPKLEGLSFFQAAEQRRRNELNGDPFTVVRERGHGHE